MNDGANGLVVADPELARWVEHALEGSIVRCRSAPTGGSRTTYLVDVQHPDGVLEVVVRAEGRGSFTGTELTLSREAVAYRALSATRVPVPAVLAERADGSGVILERVPGTDALDHLTEEERTRVLDDFVDILASMHLLDPAELHLPGFVRPRTPEDHARVDLGLWEGLARSMSDLDPLIAYCGSWLQRAAPRRVARTSFLHGDAGPGNFLTADGRVTGLVDLEFAHLGDPMDDLAWLLMRLRAEPEEVVGLLERYERASGIPVREDSLRYYRLAVDYRCAVTTSLAVARGGGTKGLAPYLMVTHQYLDGIARRIAALADVDAPEEQVDAPATAREPMYDQLLADIRAAVRHIPDQAVREATRNAQIFVHHLRGHDRYGPEVDRLDREDRHRSLGAGVDDPALLVVAAQAGARGEGEVLAYLLRRQRRRGALWESLVERRPRRDDS